MNHEELNLIIKEGEGLAVEFKEKYTSKIDRDIVALANSRGGVILLGVDNEGKVVGEKHRNPEYALKAPRKKSKEKTTEKSKEKTTEKILRIVVKNPTITTREIADAIGLSIPGVEKAIRALKQSGRLRRIGPDKGGYWKVLS